MTLKCHICGRSQDRMIIIANRDGEYQDDWVYCCWCFGKEYNEKMKEMALRKGGENVN